MKELTLADLKDQHFIIDSIEVDGSFWSVTKQAMSITCLSSEVIFNGTARVRMGDNQTYFLLPWKISLKWIEALDRLEHSEVHYDWAQSRCKNVMVFDEMGYEEKQAKVGDAIKQVMADIRPDFEHYINGKIMLELSRTPLFSQFMQEINDFKCGGHLRQMQPIQLLTYKYQLPHATVLNFYQLGKAYAIEKVISHSFVDQLSHGSSIIEKSVKLVQVIRPELVEGASETSQREVLQLDGIRSVIDLTNELECVFAHKIADYLFSHYSPLKRQYSDTISRIFRV